MVSLLYHFLLEYSIERNGINTMKLPNGYGGIYKLKGNRRKPWRVRKTDGWEIVDGKVKQKFITIGYYETRPLAIKALADYNENPYDLDLSKTTLEEVYEKWSDVKYEEVGESSIIGYKAAWKLCEPIKDIKFIDLRIDYLQKVVDESGKHYPTLRKLKVLLKALYKYAVIHQIITKDQNIIEYLDISKAGNPNAYDRKPFTEEEIEKLWNYKDVNEYYTVVLILMYTGCRIGELLDLRKENIFLKDRYLKIIESKTDAGIRTIPINKKIIPFFEYWLNRDCEYLVCTPENKHFTYRNYYDSYWKPFMQELGFKHKPHDTRHTFVSLLTAAKVDERFIQKLVGHKGQNVTRKIYTHLEIQELIQEIDKI